MIPIVMDKFRKKNCNKVNWQIQLLIITQNYLKMNLKWTKFSKRSIRTKVTWLTFPNSWVPVSISTNYSTKNLYKRLSSFLTKYFIHPGSKRVHKPRRNTSLIQQKFTWWRVEGHHSRSWLKLRWGSQFLIRFRLMNSKI